MLDLSEALSSSKSKLIRNALSAGNGIYGIKVLGFAGVLVNDRKFAHALAKKLESELGVRGYISTDELPAYGIGKAEKKAIEEMADAAAGDVVIMVVDSRELAEAALGMIEAEISSYHK